MLYKPYSSKPGVIGVLNRGNPRTQGLIGAWEFNNPNGSSIYDHTGMYGNGSLINTPTWGIGAFGPELVLVAGSTQYVQIANNPSFPIGAQSWSLEVLVKLTSLRNYNGIFTKTDSGTPVSIDTYIDSAGTLANPAGNITGLVAGVYYLIVFSAENSLGTPGDVLFRTYINGVQRANQLSLTTATTDTNKLRIGNRSDNVTAASASFVFARFWNRPLTAAEVQDGYVNPWGIYFSKEHNFKTGGLLNINESLSDTITFSDNLLISTGNSIALQDTITFTDTLTLIKQINQSLNDTLSLSDSLSTLVQGVLSLVASDSITFNDGFQQILTGILELSLSDSLSLDDTLLLLLAVVIEIIKSDSITFDDLVTLGDFTAAVIVVSDSLTLSDSLRVAFDYALKFSDSITITDQLRIITFIGKLVSDQFSLSDSIRLQGAAGLSFLEKILFTDSIQLAQSGSPSFADSMTLSDSTRLVLEIAQQKSDSISLSDSFQKQLIAILQINVGDSISFGDQFQRFDSTKETNYLRNYLNDNDPKPVEDQDPIDSGSPTADSAYLRKYLNDVQN